MAVQNLTYNDKCSYKFKNTLNNFKHFERELILKNLSENVNISCSLSRNKTQINKKELQIILGKIFEKKVQKIKLTFFS